MGQLFNNSGRYASVHASPKGPGDARPTAFQILIDNDMVGNLQDKVILITGGSNGLGVDEVKNLARTGARIFFTARDMAKGEKVKAEILEDLERDGTVNDSRIEVLKRDLRSFKSVREAAEKFMSKSDQLNILVNNAGIAMTPHVVTEDGFEQQFQVNHLAHFYLFQLLKPMLLRSSTPEFNSRVIAVASSAHVLSPPLLGDYNLEKREGGYDPVVAYGQAKSANVWFANELERRYGSQGLHAISAHPGGIETGLQYSHDEASARMVEQMLQVPHIKAAMKSVEQGAAPIVNAAIGKEYEGQGGFYMEDCAVAQPLPDDAPMMAPGYKSWACNPEDEKRLWLDSLESVGLQDD
ncbi:hypothetical protein LTR37_008401 [Vermiconidia calcicola]|uniref:Uncharacterized protein n=1 Tax=Vermiconidia calcicola TaxID=1690605 RepID=A0ACC3NC09_9PEZI|nr:hypothetical protein LTR37_008401 [Vermiconidia calcicola]